MCAKTEYPNRQLLHFLLSISQSIVDCIDVLNDCIDPRKNEDEQKRKWKETQFQKYISTQMPQRLMSHLCTYSAYNNQLLTKEKKRAKLLQENLDFEVELLATEETISGTSYIHFKINSYRQIPRIKCLGRNQQFRYYKHLKDLTMSKRFNYVKKKNHSNRI